MGIFILDITERDMIPQLTAYEMEILSIVARSVSDKTIDASGRAIQVIAGQGSFPSKARLSRKFGISYSTILRGLKVLEDEGWIRKTDSGIRENGSITYEINTARLFRLVDARKTQDSDYRVNNESAKKLAELANQFYESDWDFRPHDINEPHKGVTIQNWEDILQSDNPEEEFKKHLRYVGEYI